MRKKSNSTRSAFRILGGLIILGLSVATLVIKAVPIIWIGGFIWAGYIFWREIEFGEKKDKAQKIEAEFSSVSKWKEKAKDEQDLNARIKEISNQYGTDCAIKYLFNVEKLPPEKTSEILLSIIDQFIPKEATRKVNDNPCKTCDGFGTIEKTKTNITGKFSERVTCLKCNGTGADSFK